MPSIPEDPGAAALFADMPPDQLDALTAALRTVVERLRAVDPIGHG